MESNGDDVASGCLAAVLELLVVPTWVVRHDGTVRYANARGVAWQQLDPPRLAEELRAAIAGDATSRRFAVTALSLPGWYLVSASDDDRCIERARAQFKLTPRQSEVLGLVVVGATNRTIGEMLGITERTVEVHLTAIYERAGVENRATLVARVLRSA
jgi:DNA-binding NarL/FixJ family response regulator